MTSPADAQHQPTTYQGDAVDTPNLAARRPAETTAAASAVALLAARAFGVDDADTVTALAIVIAGIPTAVTAIVEWRRRR